MKRLLVFGLVLATGAFAADDTWILKEGQHPQRFASVDPANLPGGLLLYLPKGYDQGKWPLIVFLHGRGEAGDNPEWIRHRGLPRLMEKKPDFGFIVASPQMAQAASFFDTAALDAFVDVLLARVPTIDPGRIYFAGLSMGSRGVWAYAAAHPERVAAIVPIASDSEVEQACALKTVPTWVFHNDKDPLVPVEKVQKLVDAIKACGGAPKFTIYPNMPQHDAWNKAYATPELWEWLLAQKRK